MDSYILTSALCVLHVLLTLYFSIVVLHYNILFVERFTRHFTLVGKTNTSNNTINKRGDVAVRNKTKNLIKI